MAGRPRRQEAGKAIATEVARLRKGKPSPLYLLHGIETFLRDETLRAIRKAVLQPESADFNHDVFEWGRCKPADIVSAAQTLPFMADQRLIEVHGFEQISERDGEMLTPLLADPPAGAVVVFLAEKVDLRRTFFRKIGEVGTSLRMVPLPDRELPEWARVQAQGLGFELLPEGAALLTDLVEPSLGRIRAELEKLVAYVGSDGRADADAVRDLVGRSRAEAMYKLGDVLAAGETKQALSLLRTLLDTEAGPEFLIGFLRNQVRRWNIVKAALAQRMPPAELAEVLGVPPFAVDRIKRQVQGAGAPFLRNLYGELLAVDRRVKRSGRGAAGVQALEVFIMQMGQEQGGFRSRGLKNAPAVPGAGARR